MKTSARREILALLFGRTMEFRPLALATALSLASLPAAADVSWSGFGTVGYARSDRPYAYERFIDKQGTLKRDSILGLQMNAEFQPQWGATLQATLAPSTSDDHKWEPTLTWAFLSYRPSNDLLLRFGKLRMPMYLNSENMNVGASFDLLRLPTEVYSTAPTNDFSGASFSKTWSLAAGELGLDGYLGKTRVEGRITQRNGETQRPADLHTRSGGLVVSFRQEENVYRAGVQQAYIKTATGSTGSGSGSGPTPGGGPSDPASPGATPGASSQDSQGADIDTRVFILGVDQALGEGFRLIGEFARRHTGDTVTPKNSRGAYLSLQKKAGAWTPYVTVARLLSDKSARQATGSQGGNYDDQSSWALGTSYALSPTSKIKGEWMRVHVGGSSSLVDTPTGSSGISGQGINILSLAYSFVF